MSERMYTNLKRKYFHLVEFGSKACFNGKDGRMWNLLSIVKFIVTLLFVVFYYFVVPTAVVHNSGLN